MQELVKKYCEMGENCSRVILLAAAEKYGFEVSKEMSDSCNAISGGFCVGSICSSLVAAVMVLGVLFDIDEAKQKCLLLFFAIEEKYHNIECGKLTAVDDDCSDLILTIAQELERIIEN